MNHLLAGAACLVLLTACAASPSGGDPVEGNADGVADGSGSSERVFGTVEYYSEPFQATVPAIAEVGIPLSVTVITYGGGCLEKGETTLELEGLRAEVRPYDYDITPVSGLCSSELIPHNHTVNVTFAEAGMAEVVFYGLKEDEGGTVNVSHTWMLEVRQSP